MIGVDQLREKAREWAQMVVDLNNTPVPADMQAEKSRLLKYAKTVKESIEAVFGTMDEFSDIGLGFLPVVGAAAVAAAAGAITYWVLDYKKLVKTLDERRRLESVGVSPETAGELTKNLYGKDSGGSVVSKITSGITGPIILVGGAYFLAKQFGVIK